MVSNKKIFGLVAIVLGNVVSHARPGHTYEPPNELLDRADRVRIIMFGERHIGHNGKSFSKNREYIAQLLPYLKQRGFTHLCLEIDAHAQEAFDKYTSGKMTKPEAIKCSIEAIPCVKSVENDVLTFKDDAEKIIEKACENDSVKMRDYKKTFLDTMVGNMDDFLEEAKAAYDNGIISVMYDNQSHLNSDNWMNLINEREEKQFKNIESLLKENKKIIIHCGYIHMKIPYEERNLVRRRLGNYLNEAVKEKELLRVLLKQKDMQDIHPKFSDMQIDLE